MCIPVTLLARKFSFSFLFTVVVCVAVKSACCALFVLPVAVSVAYGVCVTGITGLIISAVISILWPWVLVFCENWAIRANVCIVCLILGISGIRNVHKVLLYLANDIGPVLFSFLEVHSSVSSPVCVAWLCALCRPVVGVDRQVGPSLFFPISTWGIGDVLSWHGYPGT